jgi:hypothetical protein
MRDLAASQALPLSGEGSKGQDIRLRVDGADALALSKGKGTTVNGGELFIRVTTAVGDLTLPLLQVESANGTTIQPRTAQPEVNGLEVTSPFATTPPSTKLGMATGQGDPSDLLYGTFLGGSGWEHSSGIAVDASGAAYVSGDTRYSRDFPVTPGALDTTHNTRGMPLWSK